MDGPRGLDWAYSFSDPAVAWVHIPTGNFVLVEAHGTAEQAGTVHGRLWIAATNTIIWLTNDLRTFYAADSEAEYDPKKYRSLKITMEWLIVLVAVSLGLPKPKVLEKAETESVESGEVGEFF